MSRARCSLWSFGYVCAENKVLREKCGEDGRLQLNDEQRRVLAELGVLVIKCGFKHVIQICTPDTLMRWFRRLKADIRGPRLVPMFWRMVIE